ncbi:hypothetical protein Clacol_007859 [Clathrus columnatus]|uniref:Uncharacterized protein n=1 Tax=Clathrus columnatus TaxID=1419009 RepID=A0AAV5ALP1_9AGAM|nr:hypothetical protein Clacol_007859 [Clathrus columnatus]
MEDSAGDDSIRETEDEDPVSITGSDDAGTGGGDALRKDTEKERERIEEQEVTALTCETKSGDLVSTTTGDDDDEGYYIDDFLRKDKGKGREIIKETEANTSEPAQYLMNCAICMDTIQDSQIYIPDPVVMIPTDENACSSAVPPQLSSTIGLLTLCPETGRLNPYGRKRGCLSLSRRRDRWRVRSMVARERVRQSRQRRERNLIERARRIPRQMPENFNLELAKRTGGVPQSRGVFEQDPVRRIGTRAMEPRNNRPQRKIFYESEQGYRDLTMKHHFRIRKRRATVVIPRQIQTAAVEPQPPSAASLPSPSHSLRVVEGVLNPRTELKSTAALRPIYMGPPPSEAGPSNLNRVARPNPQLHYIRPLSVTSSNNLFFAPPEAFPTQAWREDEEMQE